MAKYVVLFLITVLDIILMNSIMVDYIIYLTFLFVFTDFIFNLSKKINFFDIVGNIACLIYLLAPLFVYNLYAGGNSPAQLWNTFMTIGKSEYFAYALPGTLMLIIGLNYTSDRRQKIQDYAILERCKVFLKDKAYVGFLFMGLGIGSSLASRFLPATLDSILYYFNQLTFIGVLYILFSGIPGKALWLLVGLGILVGQSVVTAMYSELIFWSVFGGIILILGKTNYGFLLKLSLIFVGGLGIIILQSVKHEYRLDISTGRNKGSDPAYFYKLIRDRLSDPSSMFTKARNFGMITRSNQGLFVGEAMAYVPSREDYAYGETILKSMAASLVPRFVWPNKPQAGGAYYVCRFLGDCRHKKYSYDIGQLGEAYVNFGKVGGIVFMFIYGWFIRYTYQMISSFCLTYPTLILWVPLFYFMVLSLETDVITFLNAFTKAIVFAFFCFKSFRWILNIRL